MDQDLSGFASRLLHHTPRVIPSESDWRHAAVAVIFRSGPDGPELLFIQRAAHPEDPWSGQIAFPGGRVDPEDASPMDAARRETLEEVGLDLSRHAIAAPSGPLHPIQARARQAILPMLIHPFAFFLDGDPPELRPNHEVAEAFWVPVRRLASPQLRTWHESQRAGVPYRFRALDLGRSVPLWGLTHRMAMEILERVHLIESADDLTLPQPKA